MTPHKNRLDETVLTMGHKICFCGEIWLIIPKLSLLILLIWSTDYVTYTMFYFLQSPSAAVSSFQVHFCPAEKMGNQSRYRISSVIRWSFFSVQNNPKNLDPSYKMDLDFGDCLGTVKLVLYQNFKGLI